MIKLCTKSKAIAKSNTLWGTNYLDRERKGKKNSKKTWFPVMPKHPKISSQMAQAHYDDDDELITKIALKTKPSEDSVCLLGEKKS